MSENQKRWLAYLIVAVAVIIAGFLGVTYPMPDAPGDLGDLVHLGTTNFDAVSAEDLTATDDLTVGDDASIGGDLTVGGTASWGCSTSTIENDLTLTGTLTANTGAFTSTLSATGATSLGSTLGVGGNISLENDETISNGTDGTVQIGGLFAFTEQSAVSLTAGGDVITPTASYVPITADGAYTATVADGSVAGTVIVIINEGANDVTLEEASYNAATSGDLVLTGGADDAVTLLWDGAQWVAIATKLDN